MAYPQPDDTCIQECLDAQPAGAGGIPRCICERLIADEEVYYAEPDDLFVREWGG
ncbi:hypothetical protein [Streptomyces sp. NPDC086023]|uniref:hypothetical protein n=1 Tax=Streptomyces sp. NPDC086023 TaxID=3365746 RepID=UPI0037D2A887